MAERLIGGDFRIMIAMLCGSAYGDLAGLARDYAPEGLLVYLDNCDFNTAQYGRALHHLKLAGWFNAATPSSSSGARQRGRERLRSAMPWSMPWAFGYPDSLRPGYRAPAAATMLVNGALATLTFGPSEKRIDQTLA